MDRFTEHIGSMRRRNPSILADRESGLYYLYTPSALLDDDSGGAVVVQASADLITWSAPQVALSAGREFRGTPDIRSPRIFPYGRQYVLAVSIRYEALDWNCQCFQSPSPMGPFRPIGGALTAADDSTVDGMLFTDVRGRPWLTYVKQSPQQGSDEVCAVRLCDDLSAAAGEELLLFRATDAPWGQATLSEDGRRFCHTARFPSMHRRQDGGLLLLWTGDTHGGPAVGCAGSFGLTGPWRQGTDPLYGMGSGGASLFTALDGRLLMALHAPDEPGQERILLFEMEEREGQLMIINELTGNWFERAYRPDGKSKVAYK